MREWEKATWATGVSESQVIDQVGRLVARRLLELTNVGDSILIVAGRGHNGDDARAAMPHLKNRTVRKIDINDPKVALAEIDSELSKAPTWIVDGLFGIGLN